MRKSSNFLEENCLQKKRIKIYLFVKSAFFEENIKMCKNINIREPFTCCRKKRD